MPRLTSKYWLRFVSLGVALIAIIAAGAASESCVFNTTTNFCADFAIRCKAGQQCAESEAVCIDIGGCGDGIVDPSKGEACDDGNIEDYVMDNGMPVMVNGKPVLDDCSHDCKSTQKCGNHIVDSIEECDFGSNNAIAGTDGQFCNTDCKKISNVCGNGNPEPGVGEQCDPGPMDSMDCNSFLANQVKPGLGCKASKCGDGYTNLAALEECDTGNQKDTANCNALKCTRPTCGDSYPNKAAGEDCDDGADTTLCNGNNNDIPNLASCHIARCGDKYVNTALKEACDNGEQDTPECNGNDNGTRNTANCQTPRCGDGYTNVALKETCDNLGGNDTDSCNGNKSNSGSQSNDPTAKCHIAICGDGYLNPSHLAFQDTPEACDAGGDKSNCNGGAVTTDDYKGKHTNFGPARCHPPLCGDGYINPNSKPDNADPGQTGEECDDGPDNDDNTANACRTNCRAPHCGDHIKDDIKGEECEPDPKRPSDGNCGSNKHCDSNCKCVSNP